MSVIHSCVPIVGTESFINYLENPIKVKCKFIYSQTVYTTNWPSMLDSFIVQKWKVGGRQERNRGLSLLGYISISQSAVLVTTNIQKVSIISAPPSASTNITVFAVLFSSTNPFHGLSIFNALFFTTSLTLHAL